MCGGFLFFQLDCNMLLQASVLIPSYNNLSGLKLCLESLQNQWSADFEVIVSDDGSIDGTATYLEALSLRWPRLRWVRLEENQGRSVARNQALKLAQGALVIFLDSDMIVPPEFVSAHLNFHHRQGSGWIGQGAVIITHDAVHPMNTPFSPWTDASRAFFDSCNVSVARSALEQAGGFDPDFREYGWEDLELGLRLRQQGLRSAPVPEARGYHLEAPFQRQDWPTLIAKEAARGRGAWLFFQKHPTLEVRLITGLTPLHRFLDWLLWAGGRLDKAKVLNKLERLQAKGQEKMALALLRALLHHYHLQALAQAQRRSGPSKAE